ncbi:unnamed protein product [Caenorhabditis brenneri]
MSIYEKAFEKSDKTDAVLLVDGKKLHVNKALLSYHSTHFKTLFNAEKSVKEVKIKDVNFKDFAAFLSLVQENPIIPTKENAEKLLELADRFSMPSVKQHLELFLIASDHWRLVKIRIGEKFGLDRLVEHGINAYGKDKLYSEMEHSDNYKQLSNETKVRLLQHLLKVKE